MRSLTGIRQTRPVSGLWLATATLAVLTVASLPVTAQMPTPPSELMAKANVTYHSHASSSDGNSATTNEDWTITLSRPHFKFLGFQANGITAIYKADGGSWVIKGDKQQTRSSNGNTRKDQWIWQGSGSLDDRSPTTVHFNWDRRAQSWQLSIQTDNLDLDYTITRSNGGNYETKGKSGAIAFPVANGNWITIQYSTITFNLNTSTDIKNGRIDTIGQLAGAMKR